MLNKNMNISISEQEYATIKAFADLKGESVSVLVINAIREHIENWEDIKDAEEVLSKNEAVYPWKDVYR